MSTLIVSSSPHSKDHRTVRSIMGYVLIALMPSAVGAVIYFKLQAFLLLLISVFSCVFFEFVYNKIRKKKQTIYDGSAVVTGVLLAFNLPSTTPLWLPPVGALIAIVLLKLLFGGLGKNYVNPAIGGRIFIFLLTFLFLEEKWVTPFDGVASATPLSYLSNSSNLVTITDKMTVSDCFLGNVGGCLGETSAALLLLGGIFLLYKRIITWHIPVCFIGTVALLTLGFPRYNDIPAMQFMLYSVFSGGLFLGAFFMATDYSTSPVTPMGKIIYGVGCGLITVLIRYFLFLPEGVWFAILIMNCFARFLDTKTIPKSFGSEYCFMGKRWFKR